MKMEVKMKRYPTLQRNLQELESKIKSIFSHTDNEDQSRQRFIILSDGIEKKLVFLKNHIAAEGKSSDPDGHLDHLDSRLDHLRSAFALLKNNLVEGEPLGPPDFDARSSCSCSDESTCLHEEEQESSDGDNNNKDEDENGGVFKVYDNPIYVDDDSAGGLDGDDGGKEEEACNSGGDLKWWCYWKAVGVGAMAGGFSVAATLLSLTLHYGVVCRCSEFSISVFPPPT